MKPAGVEPSMGALEVESRGLETPGSDNVPVKPAGKFGAAGRGGAFCGASISLVFASLLALTFADRYSEASQLGDGYVCVAEPVCDPAADSSPNYGSTWKSAFGWGLTVFITMIIASILSLANTVNNSVNENLDDKVGRWLRILTGPAIGITQCGFFALLIALTILRFNESGMHCASSGETGSFQILNVFNEYHGLPD